MKQTIRHKLDEAILALHALCDTKGACRERGEILDSIRPFFHTDRAFKHWCRQKGHFGLSPTQFQQQQAAYTVLQSASPELLEHLPNDTTVLARVAGRLDKIEIMVAHGNTEKLFDAENMISRATLTATFKTPRPLPPTDTGVARACWNFEDFKLLRQHCHPDKHPERAKGWQRVWELLELAYKG